MKKSMVPVKHVCGEWRIFIGNVDTLPSQPKEGYRAAGAGNLFRGFYSSRQQAQTVIDAILDGALLTPSGPR